MKTHEEQVKIMEALKNCYGLDTNGLMPEDVNSIIEGCKNLNEAIGEPYVDVEITELKETIRKRNVQIRELKKEVQYQKECYEEVHKSRVFWSDDHARLEEEVKLHKQAVEDYRIARRQWLESAEKQDKDIATLVQQRNILIEENKALWKEKAGAKKTIEQLSYLVTALKFSRAEIERKHLEGK